ncbi:MAG: DUF1598 domain-containing protein [Planctomycetes bacterium]|nr:DUF1598 domain-containing protein [Planctomycetota bacterium]
MSAIRLGSAHRFAVVAAAFAATIGTVESARGQMGFGNQAVGGISVDARGIVANLDPRAVESLAAERRKALEAGEWTGTAGDSRKVSLKAIVAAVGEAAATNKPLPAEVTYLGGLQRIDHVFVDPDGHDVVLVGPADSLAVDAAGNVVGASTGRPPLLLEDLIVALRATEQARSGGVTCSIDPSPEGLRRLQGLLANQGAVRGDPQALFAAMEEAVGPQRVTLAGVPADSRFARVLVAADYRMKRIGMGHEPSGLKTLPSYLALVPGGGKTNALPRFWLEADYDPIARDADELAWKIGGRRMKCLTESDALAGDGVKRGGGAADPTARKWCAAMTANYDALSRKHPVFADLANCIDLAVVATLIRGNQLDARAGCDLSVLLDGSAVPLARYEVPETVATVATGVRKGSAWVVTASGGISFQPWEISAHTAESAESAPLRTAAIAARPTALAGCSWD